MAQFAPITLGDQVYQPQNIDTKGVARAVVSTGVMVADKVLTLSARTSPSGRRKAMFKLELPTVATGTVNGIEALKQTRAAFCRVEFDFDAASTTEERTLALAQAQLLLDASKQAIIKAVVIGNEGIY